jgi:hypothetical protein
MGDRLNSSPFAKLFIHPVRLRRDGRRGKEAATEMGGSLRVGVCEMRWFGSAVCAAALAGSLLRIDAQQAPAKKATPMMVTTGAAGCVCGMGGGGEAKGGF